MQASADVNGGKTLTPLIIAAYNGLADCIKYLLEVGADANIPDESGTMPIEIAATQGWKECVELLFPFTSPITKIANWSIEELFQHMQFLSSKTQVPPIIFHFYFLDGSLIFIIYPKRMLCTISSNISCVIYICCLTLQLFV
uniref:Uncharacterized protein n=1 Tax=Leersia perrieri TaxID=77586 RepID=A0A0D9XBX3_9ORYZ